MSRFRYSGNVWLRIKVKVKDNVKAVISIKVKCYVKQVRIRVKVITNNEIKAQLRGSADEKLVRGTGHAFKAKMAAVSIPIKQSYSTVSGIMLSCHDIP